MRLLQYSLVMLILTMIASPVFAQSNVLQKARQTVERGTQDARNAAERATAEHYPADEAGGPITAMTHRYSHKGMEFVGYVARPQGAGQDHPGVIVVHEWWGLNDYAKQRARDLAKLGYIALAVDMYGGGKTTDDPGVAGKMAGQVRGDAGVMRERINKGLEELRRIDGVDKNRIAAIGFCFGGTTVLELARSGADIEGVVSFHGGLGTDKRAGKGDINASVLVLHGAADITVSPEELQALKDELHKAEADWMLIEYADAKHAFTNPKAAERESAAIGYDETAARRSWQHMKLFFDELFGQGKRQGKGEGR